MKLRFEAFLLEEGGFIRKKELRIIQLNKKIHKFKKEKELPKGKKIKDASI